MRYKDILNSRGMHRLAKRADNITCLRDLDKYLKSQGFAETVRIITLKEVFDANLPDDYGKIVGSGGTCGYWGIVYKKLFDLLGYNCSLVELRSKGRKFHHVIARVQNKYKTVDFSRDYMGLGDVGSSEYSDYWYARIKREYKNAELITYDSLDNFYEDFSLYGAIYMNKEIMQVLYDYVVCVSDSDVATFISPNLGGLCEDELTYKVMCGYATENERKELALRLYTAHKNIRS